MRTQKAAPFRSGGPFFSCAHLNTIRFVKVKRTFSALWIHSQAVTANFLRKHKMFSSSLKRSPECIWNGLSGLSFVNEIFSILEKRFNFAVFGFINVLCLLRELPWMVLPFYDGLFWVRGWETGQADCEPEELAGTQTPEAAQEAMRWGMTQRGQILAGCLTQEPANSHGGQSKSSQLFSRRKCSEWSYAHNWGYTQAASSPLPIHSKQLSNRIKTK